MAKGAEVVIVLDSKGAIKNVENFNQALGQIPNVGKSASVAMRELRQEQKQAADAADLLGARIGVSLPREVKKFIASTSLIGPALATAFNASIFLALGAALFDALRNMDKLTDKFFDWSGKLAGNHKILEKTNLLLVDHAAALKKIREENALIGLTGVDLARAVAAQGAGSIAEKQADLNRRQKEISNLEAISKLTREVASGTGAADPKFFQVPTKAAQDAIDRLPMLREAASLVNAELDEMKAKALNAAKAIGVDLRKATEQAAKAAATFDAHMLDFFRARHLITGGLIDALKITPALGPVSLQGAKGLVGIPGLTDLDLMRSTEEMAEALGTGGASITDQMNEAMLDLVENHRRNYESMIDNIRAGAGRIFDSLIASGKNAFSTLLDLAKSLLMTPLRNLFQEVSVGLFAPLAAKGGAFGRIFGGTSGVGSAAATGITGGIFGSLKGALFAGGGIASAPVVSAIPTSAVAGLGGLAASGAGGAAGAGAAGLIGGMAALGPAAAIAGAAFATSMLIGWLAGAGARKRAAEAARRAAIIESFQFDAPGSIERSGIAGQDASFDVERGLGGLMARRAPAIGTVVINMLDGSQADEAADRIVERVNQRILGGGDLLADNIAWAAQ